MVAAAIVVWPGALGADETTSAGLVQSTEVVGGPHGVAITQKVRRADGQLPAALSELEITFPMGTRLNTGSFPRCSLAKLQTKGLSGCVPGSRIGSGIVRAQVPFRFPHEFAGTVRIFNGTGIARFAARRSLLVHVRMQAGPDLVFVGRWTGTTRDGRQLLVRLPRGANPLVQPDSFVRLSFRLRARRGDVSFLRAPCPRRYEATAHYGDGSVVTTSDRARCR
jgi:hypothetical protein